MSGWTSIDGHRAPALRRQWSPARARGDSPGGLGRYGQDVHRRRLGDAARGRGRPAWRRSWPSPFTRMATGELRDRVRGRLVSAEDGLGRFLDAGEEPRASDEVLRLLAEGSAGAMQERRDRLGQALAVFDAATITTTHGFCHLVLAGLGVSGQVAAGATLLEDPPRSRRRGGRRPVRPRRAQVGGAPLGPKGGACDRSRGGGEPGHAAGARA